MRYVALLRGINVGRNKRIGMADLRTALADAGYGEIRTVLASGNVILVPSDDRDEDALADDVSRVIQEKWGHAVAVVVRTAAELQEVVDSCPVAEPENGSRFFVAFLARVPERDVPAPPAETLGDDGWWVRGREIYVWAPAGMLDSPAVAHLEGLRLGVDVTVRNWNTVTKLAAAAS